jgi:hypothetical protein
MAIAGCIATHSSRRLASLGAAQFGRYRPVQGRTSDAWMSVSGQRPPTQTANSPFAESSKLQQGLAKG